MTKRIDAIMVFINCTFLSFAKSDPEIEWVVPFAKSDSEIHRVGEPWQSDSVIVANKVHTFPDNVAFGAHVGNDGLTFNQRREEADCALENLNLFNVIKTTFDFLHWMLVTKGARK
jgi:hypothetical protein